MDSWFLCPNLYCAYLDTDSSFSLYKYIQVCRFLEDLMSLRLLVYGNACQLSDPFAYSRKAPISFAMSVCLPSYMPACLSVLPHISTRLALNGFSRNLTLGTSRWVCRETPSLFKCDKTYRAFTRRPKCIHIVGNNVCSAAKRRTPGCASVTFPYSLHCCQRCRYFSNWKGRHCYISVAAIVTRTLHSVTLYVHRQPFGWLFFLRSGIEFYTLLWIVQKLTNKQAN
jgi:hypothetical protein